MKIAPTWPSTNCSTPSTIFGGLQQKEEASPWLASASTKHPPVARKRHCAWHQGLKPLKPMHIVEQEMFFNLGRQKMEWGLWRRHFLESYILVTITLLGRPSSPTIKASIADTGPELRVKKLGWSRAYPRHSHLTVASPEGATNFLALCSLSSRQKVCHTTMPSQIWLDS